MRSWTVCFLLFLLTFISYLQQAFASADVFQLDEANPAHAIIFPWVTQVVGVCVFFLLTHFEMRLPYAAAMFLFGALLGIAAISQSERLGDTKELDQFSSSVLQWSSMNSAVLLLVFLPGLIFRDAIEVDFSMFLMSLPQILILAFPMVLVGTYLVALVGYHVLPYGWPLSLALTLGAILSSTDPVAVGSVLRKLGAPPRLQLQISGESLLNDGSAYVFFTLFSTQYLAELGFKESFDLSEGFAIFFRMSLGGFMVGVTFAIGLLIILYELDRRLEPEYDVVQVVAALTMAYLSYYVSEQVCHMSGVVACVVCGIVARALGNGLIGDNQLMASYLALMEYLLNTQLFTLGGVVWGKVLLHRGKKGVVWEDFMYLVTLYVLVMLIRCFQVTVFYPVISRVGLKSSWKEAVFLSYGGLRGAVGVAFALSMTRSLREHTDDEDKLDDTEALEFMSGGVTLLTLFVNGSLAGPVLKMLGLARPVTSRKRALRLFRLSAESFISKEYQALVSQKRFRRANYNIVKLHVPFVTDELEACHRGTTYESELDELGTTGCPEQGAGEHPKVITAEHRQEIVEEFSKSHLSHRSINTEGTLNENEILIEMRVVFSDELTRAYNAELANCELDAREDHEHDFDVLLASVGLSTTGGYEERTLRWWQYSLDFATSWENIKAALYGLYMQMTGQPRERNGIHEFQRFRSAILRAMALVGAFQLAEKKLRTYVSASDLDGDAQIVLENAMERVLAEKSKDVEEARNVLKKLPSALLDSIVSHYVCTLLLRRLAKFVEMNNTEGQITRKEAKDFLARVDRSVHNTHFCRGCCTDNSRARSMRLRMMSNLSWHDSKR